LGLLFLVSVCALFISSTHASSVGNVNFIGLPGSGKTTTSIKLSGCSGATGGTVESVTNRPETFDFEGCSTSKKHSLSKPVQITDTVGFLHTSKATLKDEAGHEISGSTFALLNAVDAFQLNPNLLAISLVHPCTKRLEGEYLASLHQILELTSAVPIPYHVTFTHCSDAHCLQCKEAYQNNRQEWNKVFGCFGGTCTSPNPNGIVGRPRLIGATFVEFKGCTDGSEASCINVDKLRSDFASMVAPLQPIRLDLPTDAKKKIKAGDYLTVKRQAKDQFCSAHVKAHESLLQQKDAGISRYHNELTPRLQAREGAPLAPFPHDINAWCPHPDRNNCYTTVRECGGRRYFIAGPRRCHNHKKRSPRMFP